MERNRSAERRRNYDNSLGTKDNLLPEYIQGYISKVTPESD